MDYPDVFYTQEYAKLFDGLPLGGELHNFQRAGIDYNFYTRPIENAKFRGIVSPYGYSGPIAVDKKNSWEVFIDEFHKYCLGNNICTEFARLHPFIKNHLPLMGFGGVVQSGEVVYIDLTKPLDFDKGCRSAIKKAMRNGIIVNVGDNARYSTIMWALYNSTMERNNASKEYFFDTLFFVRLLNLPQSTVFSAWLNDEIIACLVILTHGDYAHYFLAGSDDGYKNLNTTNLLLSSAIGWAVSRGYKIFNLGGAKDKSHLSFKRSFSKTMAPFYIYKKIHRGANW